MKFGGRKSCYESVSKKFTIEENLIKGFLSFLLAKSDDCFCRNKPD
jgi:hypothetical protein